MSDTGHIDLQDYFSESSEKRVYRIAAKPQFSPLDLNLKFLQATGWSVNTDRLRFHTEHAAKMPKDHPLAQFLEGIAPHLLIRKIDKEDDYFIAVQVQTDGTIQILANDERRATDFLNGIFLGIPPAFHTVDEIEKKEG